MNRRLFLTGAFAGAVAGVATERSAAAKERRLPSKRDGSSDDLTARLAATPAGGTCHISGTWRIDHPITVPPHVTLEGHGAVLVQPTDGRDLSYPYAKNWNTGLRTRSAIRLNQGATVRGITVVGPGAIFDPATEAQHAFHCIGPGVHIDDCAASNVLGDGISFGENSDCAARNVKVDGCGRQGMSWVHGTNGLIEDCSFTRVARTVIDLEPMATLSHVVHGFTARRIKVGTYQNRVMGAGSSGEVHDVLIDELTVPAGWLAIEIEGGPRSGFTFRACVGAKPKNHPAFSFNDVHGITIDACTQPFAGKVRPPAVRAVACTGVQVLPSCSWPGAAGPLATV